MMKIKMLLIFALVVSCKTESKTNLIEGKWRCNESKKGFQVIFNNGFYSLIRWNDDLVITSKGKYFINENQARKYMTVTLIPDLQFIEKDTLFLPCENIDIISITDSVLIIQDANQEVQRFGGAMRKRDFIKLYKKDKEK